MTLPKYKITIDEAYAGGEDLGISQIAFTATPAIKVKGFAFTADEKANKLFFTDEVKMRIAAPAMIPMEIYRSDADGEYYVEFTVEEIEKIASKFMFNLNNKGKFNLEHNDQETVPAYILEFWIVNDPKQDKAYSTFGIDVPKGTLMVVSQVTDKAYYDSLVATGKTGYSIEGFLGLKLSDLINKQNKFNNTMENDPMENQPTNLPEGTEFDIAGVKYIVKDGKIVCVDAPTQDAPASTDTTVTTDETYAADATAKKDEVAKETKEEKVADEKLADPVTPDATTAPTSTPDEAAILAVIQPKLDEIYKMIADLKAEETIEDATAPVAAAAAPTKMSIHDRFKEVMKLTKED